jgi:hypothetical protein
MAVEITLNMHRLVQLFTRHCMDGDARRAANWGVGGALVGRLGKWDGGMPYEERVRLFGMLPHARSVVGHFGGGGVGLGREVVERVVCVAYWTGNVLNDGLSDFENARGFFEESLAMQRKVYGEEAAQPDIAVLLNALGNVCLSKCEYEKARGYYEESLATRRKLYGEEAAQPDIAASLNALGNVCIDKGEYEKARGYYEESLAMRRKVHGEEAANPDIATSLHALGIVCLRKGEYEKARGYYEESLAMRRKVHGEEAANPNIAMSLNALGDVFYRRG